MVASKSVLLFCLTGLLCASFSNAVLVFPITSERLKNEIEATLNKINVKSTAAVESLKLYHGLEHDFSIAGLTVLRVLRQKQDERFGTTQEEIAELFSFAHKVTQEVGLVEPYLQAALGELSRLKSWRQTSVNNLESQASQTFNNFGSLPYFCRKFFTRLRGFEGITLHLAKAQAQFNAKKEGVREANEKLAKLLEYLEKNYKEETKQARNYVNEVWNKEIRVIVKTEMFMEDNASIEFEDALAKLRGDADDVGSKLENSYDWIRHDEHYFHCAPFNGMDVFEVTKAEHKENGALVGMSMSGYLLIANTLLLLTAYSI